MKKLYGLYKQFQEAEEKEAAEKQKAEEPPVISSLPEVKSPTKNIEVKLSQKPPHDVRLPELPKSKQDQRRSAGPSLYNFYQKIIDRTAGVDPDQRVVQ